MARNLKKYRRTFDELERVASKFWPSELSNLEANVSVIPLLISTQEQFIAVIGAGAKTLDGLFNIIEASNLPANLFVKHLSILADYGGEMLQRVGREYPNLFPDKVLNFTWNGKVKQYAFRALSHSKLSNKTLHIDGKQIIEDLPLSDLQKDAIALLMFGSAYSDTNENTTIALAKCVIGDFLGHPEDLERFVKQRYIWVSRITGGAQSNNLGQLAQTFVLEYLQKHLNLPRVVVQHSGRIPKVIHTDANTGRTTSFDLVVTNSKKYVAIEVGFQVTTNSVIELMSGHF